MSESLWYVVVLSFFVGRKWWREERIELFYRSFHISSLVLLRMIWIGFLTCWSWQWALRTSPILDSKMRESEVLFHSFSNLDLMRSREQEKERKNHVQSRIRTFLFSRRKVVPVLLFLFHSYSFLGAHGILFSMIGKQPSFWTRIIVDSLNIFSTMLWRMNSKPILFLRYNILRLLSTTHSSLSLLWRIMWNCTIVTWDAWCYDELSYHFVSSFSMKIASWLIFSPDAE